MFSVHHGAHIGRSQRLHVSATLHFAMASLSESPPAPRRASRPPARPPGGARQRAARIAFYGHLWIGVIFTVSLVVISITGILLNHKRELGLMPDVPHEPTAPFATSLSLDSLAGIALRAAATAGGGAADGPLAPADLDRSRIDRMDVRPRDGYVKVRMRNVSSSEVTIDVASGRVLHVGRRGDVFLEKLHSGEAFGGGWILLSDAAAVALLLTLLSGYWLWLAPRLRRSRDAMRDAEP